MEASRYSSGPLTVLVSYFDLKDPHHAATGAFLGCRHLGELLVAALFDLKFHIARGGSIKFGVKNGVEFVSLHLPFMKTMKTSGGTVVLTARKDKLCPVAALKNHFKVNASAPEDAALFAYKSGPRFITLRKQAFIGFVRGIWKNHRLDTVSSHRYYI